jgi:GYF domain
MQSWYKDGFLPLDLPVRRDTDSEYISLQDLRLQSVDPNHPFRPTPLPLAHTSLVKDATVSSEPAVNIEPLLHPISLLAQPRHYGPPALFFSSRGGHSTAIVDARGRSVLKGRFFWSIDDEPDAQLLVNSKLGDIKRVEAFDVRDRAVIVALRQGGLEAVDVGDALLAPADGSRAFIPDYHVPVGGISRRGTYVWRIGAPVSMPPISSARDSNNTTALHLVRKKQSSTRSDIQALGFDDGDGNVNEEVLFLGRENDNVYFCERNAASFRILRLAPSH